MTDASRAGVIIALALVHIIPEAIYELDTLVEYHLGGTVVLFGVLVLVLIDNIMAAAVAPKGYKDQIRQELERKSAVCGHGKAAAAAGGRQRPGKALGGGHHHHHHEQQQHEHGGAGGAGHAAPVSPAQDAELAVLGAAADKHTHQCMRSLSASSWVSSAAAPLFNVRQYVTAWTMELGCIFHSVIIGVGVGVITEDRTLVITLMVALAIHQGLEALALGSVLALTSFSFAKRLVMLVLYSITTPVGIAIGIAVSATYDPESVTSRAVQGTLNGVSGGMLLYIGMYQLVAEEFSREDLLVRPGLRTAMQAALLLGGAAMCVIGIWA